MSTRCEQEVATEDGTGRFEEVGKFRIHKFESTGESNGATSRRQKTGTYP
jgi:hypothetical protein